MIADRLAPPPGVAASFKSSIDYALHGRNGTTPWRGQAILKRGVPSIHSASGAMTLEASTSARCVDPVVHHMLSYGPGDDVTVEMMREDARRVLKTMGMEKHQFVAILHTDTQWRHLHVIANRVNDGKASNLWRDFEKVEKECTRINAERGWRLVAGRHNRAEIARALADNPTLVIVTPRSKEARETAGRKHTAPSSWGRMIGGPIHHVLAQSADEETLKMRLAECGIGLKPQRQGIIFFDILRPDDKKRGCKGSEIGLSKATLDAIFANPQARQEAQEAAWQKYVAIHLAKPTSASEKRDEDQQQETIQARMEQRQRVRDWFLAENRRLKKLYLGRAARMKRWARRLTRARSHARAVALMMIDARKNGIWQTSYDLALATLKTSYAEKLGALPLLVKARQPTAKPTLGVKKEVPAQATSTMSGQPKQTDMPIRTMVAESTKVAVDSKAVASEQDRHHQATKAPESTPVKPVIPAAQQVEIVVPKTPLMTTPETGAIARNSNPSFDTKNVIRAPEKANTSPAVVAAIDPAIVPRKAMPDTARSDASKVLPLPPKPASQVLHPEARVEIKPSPAPSPPVPEKAIALGARPDAHEAAHAPNKMPASSPSKSRDPSEKPAQVGGGLKPPLNTEVAAPAAPEATLRPSAPRQEIQPEAVPPGKRHELPETPAPKTPPAKPKPTPNVHEKDITRTPPLRRIIKVKGRYVELH